MIELQLTSFAKARLWLSELPPIDNIYTTLLRRRFQAHPSNLQDARLAGIELYVPTGARVRYALLAGKFEPAKSNVLTIETPVSETTGDLVTWALTSNLDEVRSGLPRQYINGVLKGVSKAAEMLGSGKLILGPAAHGAIGSSPAMFANVAQALLDVLTYDPRFLSEDVVGQLLIKYI